MAAGAALGPMQSAGRTREPRWAKRTTTGTPHPEAGVHRGRTKEPDDGNSKGSGQVERPGIATDYYRTPAKAPRLESVADSAPVRACKIIASSASLGPASTAHPPPVRTRQAWASSPKASMGQRFVP